MVIYWSRRFWIWNVSGVEAVGNVRNDSRGETASVSAVSIPSLSQLRYLYYNSQ